MICVREDHRTKGAEATNAIVAVDLESGEMLKTPQYVMLLLMFIGSALAGLMVIYCIRLFGIDAPVVFVGFGAHAPERDWDDYGDIDLRGKVALYLVNDPDFAAAPGEPASGRFGNRKMTYYGRWDYKYAEAARQGAARSVRPGPRRARSCRCEPPRSGDGGRRRGRRDGFLRRCRCRHLEVGLLGFDLDQRLVDLANKFFEDDWVGWLIGLVLLVVLAGAIRFAMTYRADSVDEEPEAQVLSDPLEVARLVERRDDRRPELILDVPFEEDLDARAHAVERPAVADAGEVMPPKSTWFEPKLRSGLFVHMLS